MNNTTMNSNARQYKRAIGTFKRREDVEDTLRELRDANFDMSKVSLIARNVDAVEGTDDINQGNEAKEGAAAGATTGTVLGGIGGFLVGVGLLAVPGVGPILAAGAEINALAATLAGAGIGAASGGIIGALVGMGIPEDRAREYNDRVKAGEYLLMVSGTEQDIRRIESILHNRHVEGYGTYDAPDLATTSQGAKQERVENQKAVRDTRDLDNDGEAEVIIIDNRKEVR